MDEEKLLVRACTTGDSDTVNALVTHNPALCNSWRALMSAAQAGNAQILQTMLAHGADPDAPDPRGSLRRPLLACIRPRGERNAGHLACVEVLVEAGASLEKAGQFQWLLPLRLAAAAGHRATAELLLRANARVDIQTAAALYDTERIHSLCVQDPDCVHNMDKHGRTALHALAASRLWRESLGEQEQCIAAARQLLDAGANINALQYPEDNPHNKYRARPLWWAVSFGGCHALIEQLLSWGASPHECFLAAAFQSDLSSLALLLKAGANIDEIDVRGHTSLQHIITFKRPKAIPWLLQHGANPNLTTPDKQYTSLHLAALCNLSTELAQQLLQHGADPNLADAQGVTAAELAVQKGRDDLAHLLGKPGA